MSIKSELACENFEEGYNCCQAVVSAFDNFENKEEILKIASSFGGGIGGMRQVCGVVSGMAMVLGATKGYNTKEKGDTKQIQAHLVKTACEEFESITNSIICGELLGLPEFREVKNNLTCKQLVCIATEIVESVVEEKAVAN